MRKLASIRRIDAINPIPDADAIDVATIGGWNVVVKKGVHSIGELVIYFEIDSFIPERIAPFLAGGTTAKEYEGIVGFRLKTKKLRNCISQGLIIPLQDIFEVKTVDDKTFINIGDCKQLRRMDCFLEKNKC